MNECRVDPSVLADRGRLQTLPRCRAIGRQFTLARCACVLGQSALAQVMYRITISDNCTKNLAAHATCSIKVTFSPTTIGAKSATLNVNGGNAGLTSVSLTGS